jgi:hypothetical protein
MGNEAPEATGGGAEVLDAISGPSILSAPSGKTYGTGAGSSGSTRLSTKSRAGSAPPSTSYQQLWTACGEASPARPGQPPIANISIFGRVEVAAERNSE